VSTEPDSPILDKIDYGLSRLMPVQFFKDPKRFAIAFLTGLLLVQLRGFMSQQVQAQSPVPWGYFWQGREYEGLVVNFVEVLAGYDDLQINP